MLEQEKLTQKVSDNAKAIFQLYAKLIQETVLSHEHDEQDQIFTIQNNLKVANML